MRASRITTSTKPVQCKLYRGDPLKARVLGFLHITDSLSSAVRWDMIQPHPHSKDQVMVQVSPGHMSVEGHRCQHMAIASAAFGG